MYKEITKKEAIKRARKYCLEYEVIQDLNRGLSPLEALYEWDLLNENEINIS